MNDIEERRAQVESLASARHGSAPAQMECPFTVFASPAWRGVEADIWLARWTDATRVYKHYHPDTAFYVDAACAMRAATQAGALGAGPAVSHVWDEPAVMEMQAAGEGWRCAGLHDAADGAIRERLVSIKKKIQAGPRFERDADIFSDIRALHAFCIAHGAALSRFIDAYLRFAHRAEQAVHAVGHDTVPCHRDGNVSNLMVGPSGEVLLLDYDLAANADPFEDIGCYLMEMFDRESEARAGFEEWTGRFDEALFQRAMVYGVLDDLRWGMIATGMAATSPRKALEFSKYACWRLLRFELNSQRAAAVDRLRQLVK